MIAIYMLAGVGAFFTLACIGMGIYCQFVPAPKGPPCHACDGSGVEGGLAP